MSAGTRLVRLGIVCVIASWILAPTEALACVCVGSPTPPAPSQIRDQLKTELHTARAVFLGEALATTSLTVTFRVEAIWKGELGSEVLMATGAQANPDGTLTIFGCDASFSVGGRYLVVAHGESNETMKAGMCGFTGVVGPTTPVAALDSIVPHRAPSPAIVPRRLVVVMGLVSEPGLIEWTLDTTVKDLLARAGGTVRPKSSADRGPVGQSVLRRQVGSFVTSTPITRLTTVQPGDELYIGTDLLDDAFDLAQAGVSPRQAARRRPETVLLVHTAIAASQDEQQFQLTSTTMGVNFDLNGDGIPERIAWTARNSKLAFLALDRNGNGTIDNGTELFGTQTHPGAADGIHALVLSLMESGGGNKASLFAIDPIFHKLLLWEDRNHNGVSEPNELRLAKELITEFGLGYTGHNKVDEFGNRYQRQGWVQVRGPGQDEWRMEDHEQRNRLRRLMFDVVLSKAADEPARR